MAWKVEIFIRNSSLLLIIIFQHKRCTNIFLEFIKMPLTSLYEDFKSLNTNNIHILHI